MIKETTLLPEFDHLYLDVNGIIHSCAGSNEGGPGVSEAEIFVSIMAYLDRIVRELVKPRKSLFIAVDGVAPRAKLNQQRSRRFGSAKEARSDEETSKTSFDRNCITPGTAFMARVAVRLANFVKAKVAEGAEVWATINEIIVSGADVPGEGEHKIIQFIRERRPTFQTCERHCMYGQDADLIMLALCTHEPHFCLLREVIDFGANARNRDTATNARSAIFRQAQTADFQLLHLSILREYLQLEMCVSNNNDDDTEQLQIEPWDLECLIDDFVLITFFVGNDFLPHSPSLDIGEHAFECLFQVYRKHKKYKWKINEYLTYRGRIANKERLRNFVQELAELEPKIFADRAKENQRRIQRDRRRRSSPLIQNSDHEASLTSPVFEREMYYSKCLEIDASSNEFRRDYADAEEAALGLGTAFIRGLEWCLAYYIQGCIDWRWFYPCHYCPLLKDVARALELPYVQVPSKFELGTPLKPLEQLMSCLPPDSSKLLPKYYRELMLDANSPIAQFYPFDFRVDMHGKRNAWEGVNLLPFIDMQILLATIADRCPSSKLSVEERARAEFGQPIIVSAVQQQKNTSIEEIEQGAALAGLQLDENPRLAALSRNAMGRLEKIHVVLQHPETNTPWLLFGPPFEPKLRAASMNALPGFPSLHSLPIVNIRRKPIKLNCFGSPSRYTTLLLELPPPQGVSLDSMVSHLGKNIYVDWPLTREAKLLDARDSTNELLANGTKIALDNTQAIIAQNKQFLHQLKIGTGTPGDGGLDVKRIDIVLRVAVLKGLACDASSGALYKVYDEAQPIQVPAQIALGSPPHGFTEDPRFKERPGLPIEQRFALNSRAIICAPGRFRGCLATICGHISPTLISVQVVETSSPMREPPFGFALAKSLAPRFASRTVAAKGLELPLLAFDTIVGSLIVTADNDINYDLGLRLRCAASAAPSVVSNMTGTTVDTTTNANDDIPLDTHKSLTEFVVLGYCRRNIEDDFEQDEDDWEYSAEAVRLISAYRNKFPAIFETLLSSNRPFKKIEAKRIFGPDALTDLNACVAWLAALPTHNAPRVPTTTVALGADAISAIQRAGAKRAAKLESDLRNGPRRMLELRPQDIVPESIADISSDRLIRIDESTKNEALRLGDRVINLAAPGVPFGFRGIVVARHLSSGAVDVVFDEPFVNGSSLQGVCEPFRGALCDRSHLLAVRLAPKPIETKSHDANAYTSALLSSISPALPVDKSDLDDEEGQEVVLNNESDQDDIEKEEVKQQDVVIHDDDSLEDIPQDDKEAIIPSLVDESKTKLKSNRVARGPERASNGFDPSHSEGRRSGEFVPAPRPPLPAPSDHWSKLVAQLEESRQAARTKANAEQKKNQDSALSRLTEQYGLNEKPTKKNRTRNLNKDKNDQQKSMSSKEQKETEEKNDTKKVSLLSRARQAIQAKIAPKPITILRREDIVHDETKIANKEETAASTVKQDIVVETQQEKFSPPETQQDAVAETKQEASPPETKQDVAAESKQEPVPASVPENSPLVLNPIHPGTAMPPFPRMLPPEPRVLSPIPVAHSQVLPGPAKVLTPLPPTSPIQRTHQSLPPSQLQTWSNETDARLAALEKRTRAALKEKQVPLYVNESVKVPERSFTYGFQPDLDIATQNEDNKANSDNEESAPKKSSFQYIPMTTTTQPVARKSKSISGTSKPLILPSQLLGKRRT
eukprot:CAMPEP_0197315814 /NCGR_PEP_ID=MMETSP0891-20130614/39599_1 /TAXON_ID=44058 ORGANISM="Aureoumbra lagunensis, Strain CCMP1510" /NCGR_SAMPLE_ID=MMETSP0891 /ASSEMBLY_ACC=CAM_ASM_000534 /LENGTH=1690 /DNA_ID=CAMNT_0042804961 /DNA_START=66 /DNA_END=5141 /DNA_ORIENTATION=+